MDSQATPVADEKPCPYCVERIKRAARKCRFCGSFLDGTTKFETPPATPSRLSEELKQTSHESNKKPSGRDAFLQLLEGVEHLATAGLWLTVLVALILFMRAC